MKKGITIIVVGIVTLCLLSGFSLAGNEVIFFEDFEDAQHVSDNWKFRTGEGTVQVVNGSLYLSNPGPDLNWQNVAELLFDNLEVEIQKSFDAGEGVVFAWDINILDPANMRVPVILYDPQIFAVYTESVLFEDHLALGLNTNTKSYGWIALGGAIEVPGFFPGQWYRIEIHLYEASKELFLIDLNTGEELFSIDRTDVGMEQVPLTEANRFFIAVVGPGELQIDNFEIRRLSK